MIIGRGVFSGVTKDNDTFEVVLEEKAVQDGLCSHCKQPVAAPLLATLRIGAKVTDRAHSASLGAFFEQLNTWGQKYGVK